MSAKLIFQSGATKFQNLTNSNAPYNPFGRNADPSLAKVPVALAGSTNSGIFWQIGGGGMNGIAADYCDKLGVLDEANQQLAQAAQSFGAQTAANVSGRITPLHLSDNAPVQDLLYTASPDLSGMSEEEAKKAMQQFGREFRKSLAEQNQSEVIMPLFSGGIYSGGHDKEKIAKWTMQGFFAEEEKSNLPPMENVYFAAPQFTQQVLQEAKRDCQQALVGTQTRAEAKTPAPKSPQKENSNRPQNARDCAIALMQATDCKNISIVTSPSGNPQARFSFDSPEEMEEALEKLRGNEKLKNSQSAAGEPWQIKQGEDGKCTVTLRSSETFLVCGFGRGDQQAFAQNMQDLKIGLEQDLARENRVMKSMQEAARKSIQDENENPAKRMNAAKKEATEVLNSLRENASINSGAGEKEAAEFLSVAARNNGGRAR